MYGWAAKNKKLRRKNVNKWRHNHPEYMQNQNKRYREERRFNTALNNSRGNAKRRGFVSCTATVEEIERMFSGKCDVCGKLYEYSDEHSPWTADTEWFDNFKDTDWAEDEEQTEHYCPDHWQWSEDGDTIIRKEATVEKQEK